MAATAATTNAAAATATLQRTSLEKLLSSAKLSSFPVTKGQLLVLDLATDGADLVTAFQKLVSFGVLSAPVYDATAKRYVGFLELRDLVTFVIQRYDEAEAIALVARSYDGPVQRLAYGIDKKKSAAAAAAPASSGSGGADVKHTGATSPQAQAAQSQKSVNEYIDELLQTGSSMLGATSMTLQALSKRHPFRALPSTASLLDAAKLMSREHHRVGVLDASTGKLVNIVSQSTIVDFIHKNIGKVSAEEAARSIDDWGMGSRPVRAVECTERTVDVFRRILDESLPGVVLTDAYGSYTDFVNSSYLRLFLSRFYSSANIEMPIGEFVRDVRQIEARASSATATATTSPQSASAGTGAGTDLKVGAPLKEVPMAVSTPTPPNFAEVVARLATSHSHYMCITSRLDEKYNIPILVCSVGDVVRAVLRDTGKIPHASVPPRSAVPGDVTHLHDPSWPKEGSSAAGAGAAAGNTAAYNDCTHPASVPHWYSDHGHCLHARHTCARRHRDPPHCEWPDNSFFCRWDLGYTGYERQQHAARGSAERALHHSVDPVKKEAQKVGAELHRHQDVAAHSAADHHARSGSSAATTAAGSGGRAAH